MNEEIVFLREHLDAICRYKGFQEELTYDVSLEILKRVCMALNYLQQKNHQLKDRIEKATKLIKDKTKIIPDEEGGGLILCDYDIRDLIQILKGEENE